MKKRILSALILLITYVAGGQTLYSKSYGDKKDIPVIFLHGGPGYNSVNFEATTAKILAAEGFYVIVYDRRSEGRSKDLKAQFTFKETFEDLDTIYQKYGLAKPILIGHSFGGVVATLFAEKYPEKIQSIVLVSVPVSLQETFKTILSASKIIYQKNNDSVNLNYISMLENMDKNSIEYSSYSFMHAMKNGFYSPKDPTAEAKSIYSQFKTDTLLTKYAFQMSYQAPKGFWKNENYTGIDLTTHLRNLQANNIKVRGLYGKDDGLFSAEQVKKLQNLLGERNMKYLDNCSHNVFIDRQSQFIDAVKTWSK